MEEMKLFDSKELNGVPMADIEMLFDYWKEIFGKRSSTVLDEARSKKLSAAIKAYGIENCKKAIKGCSLSDWHSGRNPGNKKYHDLTLIFRNADKVEMFIDIYDNETTGEKELNEWLNS